MKNITRTILRSQKVFCISVFQLILMGLYSVNAQHCQAAFSAHQPDPNEPIISFTDESTSDGHIIYWSWNFANGPLSVEQNPTVVFPGPGTYNVCLYIEDDGGCTSEVCHDVVVHHPPAGECHALFGAHELDSIDFVINFSDLSTSSGHIISWHWDFGDGHTSDEQNPSHIYQHPGTYLVCLYVADDTGCTAHFCHEIVVHHPAPGVCHAHFGAHQSDQNELQMNFTDLSTSEGHITSWLWELGDGHTSNEQNPSHTYAHAGTYLVCLFTADDNGCTSHFCHHVTLHQMPTDVDHSVYRAPLMDAKSIHKSISPNWPVNTPLVPLPALIYSKGADVADHGPEPFIRVYPNPVIDMATIIYELSRDAQVKLEILDLAGQQIMNTDIISENKGLHTITLNVSHLRPGIYVTRLTVGVEVFTQRLMIAY